MRFRPFTAATPQFCGNYAALDGGHTGWAFSALTGDPVFKLIRKGEGTSAGWERLDMEVEKDTQSRRAVGFYRTDESHESHETFFLLRAYSKRRSLMGASFGAYKSNGSSGSGAAEGADANANAESGGKGLNGETLADQGLVAGHAYSVLDAKAFTNSTQPGGRLKLIQLRNPVRHPPRHALSLSIGHVLCVCTRERWARIAGVTPRRPPSNVLRCARA